MLRNSFPPIASNGASSSQHLRPFKHAVLAALLITNFCNTAFAADGANIAADGKGDAVPACSACHGEQGEGQPAAGFPRLAGFNAAYIEHALSSFARNSRPSAIMGPIAKGLSPDDRQAVAAYFAALHPPVAKPQTAPDGALVAAGAAIALHGDSAQGVPACAQCHGADGFGADLVPGIAGQSQTYIAGRLVGWKKSAPTNKPHSMAAVAQKLDDDQVNAVAAYFASLPAAGSTRAPSTSGGGVQ
jgi:cytochrome c553